jgi:hypothetical protein
MSGTPTSEPALPEDEPLRDDTPVDNAVDDDEFLPEDFEDDPNDDRPRSTRKRVGLGGQMIGAAMLGLAEVLEPKQKQDAPIEVTNPGKPLDLDKDGLDEAFGNDGSRLQGPPLDAVKAKARSGRPVKRRR